MPKYTIRTTRYFYLEEEHEITATNITVATLKLVVGSTTDPNLTTGGVVIEEIIDEKGEIIASKY